MNDKTAEQTALELLNNCRIFYEAQDLETALNCCDQAIALEATNEDAWQAKGFILDALGRHEAAIAAYDRALALNPNSSYTLASKGIRTIRMGSS